MYFVWYELCWRIDYSITQTCKRSLQEKKKKSFKNDTLKLSGLSSWRTEIHILIAIISLSLDQSQILCVCVCDIYCVHLCLLSWVPSPPELYNPHWNISELYFPLALSVYSALSSWLVPGLVQSVHCTCTAALSLLIPKPYWRS